jgi:hypothetical protein
VLASLRKLFRRSLEVALVHVAQGDEVLGANLGEVSAPSTATDDSDVQLSFGERARRMAGKPTRMAPVVTPVVPRNWRRVWGVDEFMDTSKSDRLRLVKRGCERCSPSHYGNPAVWSYEIRI